MAIRITLECGHASMLRVRTTPEGYTHDWEVFVRGVDGADISQYIEKVIFNLHETFPKPKRLFKEPPYVVKESGYAGFVIPITIYLKNKDEPKKIQIQYDLTLQHGGPAINNVTRHSEIFTNPADDFRRKLLKGGGIQVPNTEEGHDKSESKVSVPMVGKPKLSGSDGKKSHRPIEPRSEFADLFGVIPIKSTKVSPEVKKTTSEKTNYQKTSPDKIEKNDKSSKTKHSPHKDGKKEKVNDDNKKEKKDKDSSKDKERSKDRKRPLSPVSRNNYQSPSSKRSSSPPPLKKQHLSPPDTVVTQKSVSPKTREKEHKKPSSSEREKSKDKLKEAPKISNDELKGDKKKRKHKDDKDSDRKEKNRERERERSKELKITDKKLSEKTDKHEKLDKDKLPEIKTLQKDDKKSSKDIIIIDKQNSKIRTDSSIEKVKDVKTDKERQKHKHRKKDKKEKRDESKEREKREKKEKQKNLYTKDGTQSSQQQQQPSQQLPPPASSQQQQQQSVPIVPPASSTIMSEIVDHDTSDSPNSGDDEPQIEQKSSSNTKSTTEKDTIKISKSDSRLSPSVSAAAAAAAPKKEKIDKIKKEKLKLPKGEERESKKRKKRDDKGDDEIPVKRHKDSSSFSPPLEPVSSSQSPVTIAERNNTTYTNTKDNHNNIETTTTTATTTLTKQNFETETEQIAPDSTNNILIGSENDEPLVFSDDYVSQLKDLQQKIMTLQDNDELQRVVQVIAATGQYEITRKTFDFDLCALDRRTVQRLQQFFSQS